MGQELTSIQKKRIDNLLDVMTVRFYGQDTLDRMKQAQYFDMMEKSRAERLKKEKLKKQYAISEKRKQINLF